MPTSPETGKYTPASSLFIREATVADADIVSELLSELGYPWPAKTIAQRLEAFTRAFDEALAAHDLTTIVAKVEAVGPAAFVTDLALLENRFEFQKYLRSR